MNNLDLMDYWFTSSDSDYETMLVLYKNKKIHGVYLLGI